MDSFVAKSVKEVSQWLTKKGVKEQFCELLEGKVNNFLFNASLLRFETALTLSCLIS